MRLAIEPHPAKVSQFLGRYQETMNDEHSLENIRDWEQRMKLAPTDPVSELFIRRRIANVVSWCPMNVLLDVANHMLEIRKRELRSAGDSN